MKKTLQLQKDFVSHIYKKSDQKILDLLPYSKAESLSRLSIYRNNVFGNFTSVLESVYEVVQKLVGEEYFLSLAEKYAKKYPSKSGNLDNYGEYFSEFLKQKKMQHKLPYLSDIAKLEYLFHKCYFSKEADDFDIENFQKISPEDFSNLTLKLHPSVFLLKSKFSIFSIWKDNIENDGKNKISIENSECVLIDRANGNSEVKSLSREEFIFLSEIEKQNKLYEVYKKIARNNKKEGSDEPDIGKLLEKFIQLRIINNFKIN